MSSLHNQPVVEDIVSAFETTQNQSWSIFNGKLGSIPIKNCKEKDIIKSENPIKLSDEDFPVFGYVPRLEKLMLVSCNKCSMVIKRDCIHYHYKRRHNNPESDDFSLERFILSNEKINKYKKQKINVRKIPEKKNDGVIIDPVVHGINTKHEKLLEEDGTKIKQKKEINHVNEQDNNFPTKSCNDGKNYITYDWTCKPLTIESNLSVNYEDHKINDKLSENNDFKKLPSVVTPVNIEELQSNKNLDNVLSNEHINYVTISSDLLVKSFNLNKNKQSKIALDFSNIMSDDIKYNCEISNNYKNKNDQLPTGLQSISKEIFSSKEKDISSDDFSSCNHSSVMSDTINDNSKIHTELYNDELIIEQLPTELLNSNTQTKYSITNKYSDKMVKEKNDEINDKSKIITKQFLSELAKNETTIHASSNADSNIPSVLKENYNKYDTFEMEFCQLPSQSLNNETKTKYSSNDNMYSKVIMNSNTVGSNGHLSNSSFGTKKLIEENKCTLINNKIRRKTPNYTIHYSEPVLKESKPSNRRGIDDDNNPKNIQDSSEGRVKLLRTSFPCLTFHYKKLNNDNHEITDDSDNDDPDDDFTDNDQSKFLYSVHYEDESKDTSIIEDSDIIDNNVGSFGSECNELTTVLLNNKQITSLDIGENIEPDLIFDDDSNDSITSSDQSTIPSQESKSTQTSLFLNQINSNQLLEPNTRIDELLLEQLRNQTKNTQTGTLLDCKDCYKTTKYLIDGCILLDSEIEGLIKRYTSDGPNVESGENSTNNIPANLNAQMDNISIPSSTRESDILDNSDSNHCVFNCSHYLSSFQPNFCSLRNHADKSKQEYIYFRNESTYIDNNYVITKDRLNKSINKKIVFSKNCKLIPREYRHIEVKVKKNLKRRLGEQVAGDKENQNSTITGHVKKFKRVEFVKQKVIYSDESDNNDNVDG